MPTRHRLFIDIQKSNYLKKFISSVLDINIPNEYIANIDLEYIFHQLSRYEEAVYKIRDQWGNWDWQYNQSQREGNLYKPHVDLMILSQFNRTNPLWPDNKKFAVCLTHDADIVPQYPDISLILRSLRIMKIEKPFMKNYLKEWLKNLINISKNSLLNKLPTEDYQNWIKMEDNFGFKSTFYFFSSKITKPYLYDCSYKFHDKVHYDGRKVKVCDMIKDISKSGWEVGLHGSYYSAFETKLLKEQKENIESIIQKPVISNRQHYLSYDIQVTPQVNRDAGIKVDSTLGFNRSIGFRAGTSFPFFLWDYANNKEINVLEIPPIIMDGALFTENALEYNQELALKHSIEIMNEVEKVGGVFTLSWHPGQNEMWQSVYRELIEEAKHHNAWGCSVEMLYNHWKKRIDAIEMEHECAKHN